MGGSRRYAAVSLFAGCGGLDLGAEQSGRVRGVWAIDNDSFAVATYRRNLGDHIVLGDVRDEPVPEVPCDILLAGPPCQDFSYLWNHDGAKTARGNLFREVSRFLALMQPAAFILENVPGLLAANEGAAWTILRHALRAPASFLDLGAGARYQLSADVVDMADLGVPQHRNRLIVMGIRNDIGIRPPQIRLTHEDKHVIVKEVLDDIPLPPVGTANHEVGLDSPEVVARLKLIPPGKNYTVIPKGHPLAVKGLISHVYRRLDPSEPAYTIIASGGGGTHGYHHHEPRRLSNRERARLQGFPDDFIFEGGQIVKSRYPNVRRQIGNAVPPLAAKAIVGQLAECLHRAGVPFRPAEELRRARQVARRTKQIVDLRGSELAEARG